MGIYDRDYIRDDRAPGLGGPGMAGGAMGAMRMWSVNTWIIVLCVAVFIIDGFAAQYFPVPVELDRRYSDAAMQYDPSQFVVAEPKQVHRIGQPFDVPIIAPDGEVIGAVRMVAMSPLNAWLHFSTALGFQRLEFWRFIGFQFLHANLTHLLFNMIGLYFFGPLVEQYLGSKRYLAFYLLCGIFGALMYTLLNLGGMAVSLFFGPQTQVPLLLFNSTHTPLIGASAGVFGVLMAGAYLAPNAVVLLFFILPMRLKTLAYGLVLLALFSLFFRAPNAGGEAGHLGGAIAGWYFIRHPRHLHGFFDLLGRADPTSHHYRRDGRTQSRGDGRKAPAADREVDRILAKISAEGIQSLTDEEKRVLRERRS